MFYLCVLSSEWQTRFQRRKSCEPTQQLIKIVRSLVLHNPSQRSLGSVNTCARFSCQCIRATSTWQGISCGQEQSICQRVPYSSRMVMNVWHFQFWPVYMRGEAAHPSPDTSIDRHDGGRRLGIWWWPGLVHFVQVEEGRANRESDHYMLIIASDLTVDTDAAGTYAHRH
jgi:hypothetical protein